MRSVEHECHAHTPCPPQVAASERFPFAPGVIQDDPYVDWDKMGQPEQETSYTNLLVQLVIVFGAAAVIILTSLAIAAWKGWI